MQSLALEHCAPPLLFVFFPTTGTAPARQQQRRSLFVKYSRFWAFQQGVDSFFLPVRKSTIKFYKNSERFLFILKQYK
jgi:hypothetical protein